MEPIEKRREEDESVAEERAGPSKLVIIVSSERGVTTSSVRAGAELIVGRAASATLRIDDASVSRRHARVTVHDRIFVEDLGSANGTRIGGRWIEPRTVVEVSPGTTIMFGHATMLVHQHPASVPARGANEDTTHPPPPLPEDDAVVVDPEMQRIYELARRIADSPISVLLLGETGVGKEVLARTVHQASGVHDGPFVELNCAALTESLLEAELFGYMRGAFTGAHKDKPGLIETARNGSLFLDEIGEMSLSTQAKMLRFLESGDVLRIGGLRTTRVRVRIIAATNRDVRALIEDGRFRADLFFRLSGITIQIPPLRQRRCEIVPLAERLLQLAASRQFRSPPRLSPGAMAALKEHDWPGNVRELRNTVERALALSDSNEIGADALQIGELPTKVFSTVAESVVAREREPSEEGTTLLTSGGSLLPSGGSLPTEVAALELQRVMDALGRNQGNQSAAARDLGIARTTLIRRMKRFGLAPKE